MMKTRLRMVLVLGLASQLLSLSGCTTAPSQPPENIYAARSTRNNSYSLLYQLLSDEKDVSKLRFIKREPSDLKDLVNRIASASRDGAKLLEQFAHEDPSIVLNDTMLPSGEVATRDAIASTKMKQLLGGKGDDFELALTLTQLEALNYGAHLARVTAKNEPDSARARSLTALADQMTGFYNQAFGLLLSRSK